MGAVAKGTFLETLWQLIRDLLFSPAFWGFAGVLAGGWLTWRREVSLKRQERERDMQFAAVSLSATLSRFIGACADVAGDDGTYRGQAGPDGILQAQTDQPGLDYDSLEIKWSSLPSLIVDKLFIFQNHVGDEHDRLEFERDSDGPPYDGYFFERRLAFVELGIQAESLVNELRRAGRLEPHPETRSSVFLREQRQELDSILAKRAASSSLPTAAEGS